MIIIGAITLYDNAGNEIGVYRDSEIELLVDKPVTILKHWSHCFGHTEIIIYEDNSADPIPRHYRFDSEYALYEALAHIALYKAQLK